MRLRKPAQDSGASPRATQRRAMKAGLKARDPQTLQNPYRARKKQLMAQFGVSGKRVRQLDRAERRRIREASAR